MPLPPGPPPGADFGVKEEDFAAPLPSLPPPGLEAAAEGGITGTKRSIDAVDEADEVEAKRST